MNINKIISKKMLLLIATLTLTLTACGVKNKASIRNNRAKSSTGDILIGAAGPWAEIKAEKGDLQQGILLAIDEINSSGGLLGRKVKVIWKDDLGMPRQAKLVAQELCNNPDVIAVIGHVNSSAAIAASVLYNHNGVLMLSPTATTPELTARQEYSLIFRNIATDSVIAETLAKYAANTGFKNRAFIQKIIIYNEDDVYGNVLAKEFEKQTNIFKIKTVTRRTYGLNSDEIFFKNDLKHVVKIYNFDAIFIAGLNKHAAMIINEVSKLGANFQIFCGEGVDGDRLIKLTGMAADEVTYCSTYNPDRKNKKLQNFKNNFKKRFGHLPKEQAAQGYDAAYVLAAAIKKAGTTIPTEVAESLHTIKYDGVAGRISFDSNGDLIEKNVVLKKINNNKEKVITN